MTESKVFHPDTATDQEFLDKLRELAENWRWSDEYIGQLVRIRWPRNYAHD